MRLLVFCCFPVLTFGSNSASWAAEPLTVGLQIVGGRFVPQPLEARGHLGAK